VIRWPIGLRGRDANEIERARISIMARSLNAPSPNHHFRLATRGRSIQMGHLQTKCAAAKRSPFDYLVGAAEQRKRYREAERLGGFKIEHELDFRRLLKRQISRLLTFKYSSDVDASLPKRLAIACTVAHQPARRRECAVWSIISTVSKKGAEPIRRASGCSLIMAENASFNS